MPTFKDYDKAFAPVLIANTQTHWGAHTLEAHKVTWWAHGYVQPDQPAVQYAVYEAADFLRWQLFRVSLKGLSTSQKLYMLDRLWVARACNRVDYGMVRNQAFELWERDVLAWIRINNYIGALRRGGLMTEDMRVTGA